MARSVRMALMASLLSLAFLPGFSALAAELSTPLQSCTTPDCGATLLLGRLNKSDRCCGFSNLPLPWVVQLFAGKQECLRLRVTSQKANSELVAIAPGTRHAWRNDSSALTPCPTCPLLKIHTGNDAGWFLVQVNPSRGVPGDAEFTLSYARYAADNPNCAQPTRALPPP
jgi:hypothetical protein